MIGGFVLLLSAILLIVILVRSHFGEPTVDHATALCAGGESTACRFRQR